MHQIEDPFAAPVARARALSGRDGLVFLDSSLPDAGSLSIVACEPDLVLSGRDWQALEQELVRRRRCSADIGAPVGAAIGWVDFDGTFWFGFYEQPMCYLHGADRWLGPAPADMVEVAEPSVTTGSLSFRPRLEREDFLRMVRRSQEYIAAGDIYQVCLAHPFEAKGTMSSWDYYERLRCMSPAPHGAYMRTGGVEIASASPECFLKMSGRRIRTCPIKGTRPRSDDPQIDQRHAFDLRTSPKEIAELVMITDLERNDLGQVCDYGTVTVPDLLRLERFEQVHHLVSTVEGDLRAGVSHVAALRACFPGGSISGAPKKRALEIIRELEPFPRGLFTGAIGYFGFNGESQFSIAIRTAVFSAGIASFHAGAGIVADSVPEREWEETLHKAAGLLAAAESPAARHPVPGPARSDQATAP